MSWIRKRDSHILTVGSSTFISDGRFYILKPEKRHVWTLRIRYVLPTKNHRQEFQLPVNYKIGWTLTFLLVVIQCTVVQIQPKMLHCINWYFEDLKERNFCPLWYNACTVLKLDFFFSPPYFLIGSDHLSTRCSILTYVFMYSRYVQPRDAGLYECQVSTEPKMSHFVQLNIVGKKIHFSTSLFLVYYTECIMYPTTCISRTYCHNWG